MVDTDQYVAAMAAIQAERARVNHDLDVLQMRLVTLMGAVASGNRERIGAAARDALAAEEALLGGHDIVGPMVDGLGLTPDGYERSN